MESLFFDQILYNLVPTVVLIELGFFPGLREQFEQLLQQLDDVCLQGPIHQSLEILQTVCVSGAPLHNALHEFYVLGEQLLLDGGFEVLVMLCDEPLEDLDAHQFVFADRVPGDIGDYLHQFLIEDVGGVLLELHQDDLSLVVVVPKGQIVHYLREDPPQVGISLLNDVQDCVQLLVSERVGSHNVPQDIPPCLHDLVVSVHSEQLLEHFVIGNPHLELRVSEHFGSAIIDLVAQLREELGPNALLLEQLAPDQRESHLCDQVLQPPLLLILDVQPDEYLLGIQKHSL